MLRPAHSDYRKYGISEPFLTTTRVSGKVFPVAVAIHEKIVSPDRHGPLCVLKTTGGVREILWDCRPEKVIRLCENHYLDTSFDIGMGSCRDLRVLPSAILFYKQYKGSRRRRLMWSEILAELTQGWGSSQQWVPGAILRQVLNCSSKHVINLVNEGWLEAMPGSKPRPGPSGSPRIKRASFEDFLNRRRI